MDAITLTLDDGRTSVIESLGKRVHVIEGDFPEGADGSWTGGNSNVGANGAIETTYIFDVKDATMIYNATLDATISNFDKNTDVGVTTEYLSVPSQINATTTYTTTTYFDAGQTLICEGNTTSITNGFQFALFTFTADFYQVHSTGLEIAIEYSYDNSTWRNAAALFTGYLGNNTAAYNSIVPFSLSGLISGSTGSSLYFRASIYVDDANYLRVWSQASLCVQIVPRHTHAITTVYNKVTPANSPPSTILVKLNSGGTYTSVTPGTPQALSVFGTLATGKNTIYVKTPSGATNMCSVNPTITYQSLKS